MKEAILSKSCDSLDMTFWKRQKLEVKNRSVVARGEGWREGVIQTYRMRKHLGDDGTALYLDCADMA